MKKRKILVIVLVAIGVVIGACSTDISCTVQDGERYCEFHLKGEVTK